MNELLSDAQRVAKGAARPNYTRRQYEGAMLDLAAREVQGNETPTAAFARLCAVGDARMGALYKAAAAADVPGSDGRFAEQGGVRGFVGHLMNEVARYGKRQGESDEQALARLMREDQIVRDAYALYCELA